MTHKRLVIMTNRIVDKMRDDSAKMFSAFGNSAISLPALKYHPTLVI